MSDRPLIVNLGFARTGTTSLHVALQTLGWNSIHDAWKLLPILRRNKAARLPILSEIVPEHNAVAELGSLYSFFPMIDRDYPGSKFILTVRNGEEWYRSAKAWNPKRGKARREITAMEYHERSVRGQFHFRPQDLLVMRICDGDGWEKLCPFLGVEIPDEPFPHCNVGTYQAKGKAE